MFTAEHASSNLPFSAKSSLQMLLKTRETAKQNIHAESSGVAEDIDNYLSCSSILKNSIMLKNCAAEASDAAKMSNNTVAADMVSKNKEQADDFSYSQKLFHIADGNLYSIFSPIQGRSYGVKPSFLRKQRCTIQECHGRGRKGLRKGLKFHNFLPSESITSEKDESFLEQKWKIHSECKLREEHGTKQIMVSNWFQSVKSSEDADLNENNELKCAGCKDQNEEFSSIGSEEVSKPDVFVAENHNIEQKSVNTPSLLDMPCNSTKYQYFPFSNSLQTKNSKFEVQNDVNKYKDSSSFKKGKSVKFSMLNNLLYEIENSKNAENGTSEHEVKTNCDKTYELNPNDRRCRRKPHHTRRIVPYNKYLSILEENNKSPLDLSLRNNTNSSIDKNAEVCGSVSGESPIINETQESFNLKTNSRSKYICYNVNNQNTGHQSSSSYRNSFAAHKDNHLKTCLSTTYLSPRPPKTNGVQVFRTSGIEPELKLNFPTVNIKPKLFETPNSLYPSACESKNDENKLKNASHTNFNKSKGAVLKNFFQMKPRKRSQRSAIKQKLEDTFRQNGFLVKTKQVSDGEATFCKFRQLRKYTRYYLKSWQHHLPEELHKMWKGFLPPKTALPPILDSMCNKNSCK